MRVMRARRRAPSLPHRLIVDSHSATRCALIGTCSSTRTQICLLPRILRHAPPLKQGGATQDEDFFATQQQALLTLSSPAQRGVSKGQGTASHPSATPGTSSAGGASARPVPPGTAGPPCRGSRPARMTPCGSWAGRCSGRCSKQMRTGTGTPSPTTIASPLRSAGRKFSSPCEASGSAAADDVLILVVGHAQREDRVALRQQARRQLGRPLADDAQRHAVFAAFLGDARERALGRLEAGFLVARRVAMRLLADEQDRHLPRRSTPRSRRSCRQSTDTTTLRTSDGTPERSMIVIGLPSTGMRKMRDRISAMLSRTVKPLAEHEAVAPVGLQRSGCAP